MRALRLGLLVIAATLLAPAASADAVVRPNGDIAFTQEVDSQDEVVLVGPDGTGRRVITVPEPDEVDSPLEGPESEPVWSPGGTRLLVNDGGGGWMVLAFDGTAPVLLEDSAGLRDPQWSPDGTLIAGEGDGGIRILRADGSGGEALDGAEGAFEPVWSPDGERLLMTIVAGEQLDLMTIGADGSNPDVFGSAAEHEEDPAWSPDGARIAYATAQAGEIVVAAPDGTEPDVVASGRAAHPRWSPDGTRILFDFTVLGDPTEEGVATVGADGTGRVDLTEVLSEGPGEFTAYRGDGWSPDGSRALIVETNLEDQILSVDADDGSDTVVLAPGPGGGSPYAPDWGPAAARRWSSSPGSSDRRSGATPPPGRPAVAGARCRRGQAQARGRR